jgi:SAM-dependent methyltransferase
MSRVVENIKCLACDSDNIHIALDLGLQPLANNYKESVESTEDRYPLAVKLCYSCKHLQLSHSVDPAIIYKNYLYATGTNQTIQDYCKWFANFIQEYIGVTGKVLDIGCNDGTQLNYFKDLGFDTYGIDPAKNLYDRSRTNHNVICDFFGPDVTSKLSEVNYDVIVAQNVCAHNPDPATFLESCRKLMSDTTLLFVQTSQADMVLNNEFDTIYHEHVNFFNANSMKHLAERVGLYLNDVQKSSIHGNSYIFVLSTLNSRPYHVQNIIDLESSRGLLSIETYNKWNDAVIDNVKRLTTTLNDFKNQGYTLVGYGAAAKGNTLLNYINQSLNLIIDDNPLKQNMYTPGTNIPIKSIDALTEFNKNEKILFMPLAWNFFAEITHRIKMVRDEPHDLFLKYFPKVEIKNV